MGDPAIGRKQRRLERERQEVMDVALELFAAKGFHNVTMQEIAQRSEFSVGKLYSFFETKEALYQALVLKKAEHFSRCILQVMEEGGPVLDVIEKVVATQIELLMGSLEGLRLYLSESRPGGLNIRAGLSEPIRRIYDQCLERLGHLFARAMDQGLVRKADPYVYALALDGMVTGLLVDQAENPGRRVIDPRQVVSIFFDGVREKKGESHGR